MPFQQLPRDPGRQDRFTPRGELHGADQFGGTGVLEEEAARPGPQGARHARSLAECRQHHDTGAGRETGDVLGGRDAVPGRHLDVEEGDVDVLGAACRGGFPTVARLGDHLDVLRVLQDQPDCVAAPPQCERAAERERAADQCHGAWQLLRPDLFTQDGMGQREERGGGTLEHPAQDQQRQRARDRRDDGPRP